MAFGKRCGQADFRTAIGSVGVCYDNALGESLFASLECELLDRRRFAIKARARIAFFEYTEGFYSTIPGDDTLLLGYPSSLKYERRFKKAA